MLWNRKRGHLTWWWGCPSCCKHPMSHAFVLGHDYFHGVNLQVNFMSQKMCLFFKAFARTCQIALQKGLGQSQMPVGEGEGRWEEMRGTAVGSLKDNSRPFSWRSSTPRPGSAVWTERMVNGETGRDPVCILPPYFPSGIMTCNPGSGGRG